jgi:hypothetical protein
MSDQFRFFDALTYGVRTLFWRPVRAIAFIAAMSVIYGAYYLWAQTDDGIAFFTGYIQSSMMLAQGSSGDFFGNIGIIMAASLISGSIMAAGAYRVFIRERSLLPIQFGLDELRTMALYVIVTVMMFGITLVAMLVLGILVFILMLVISPILSIGESSDPAQAAMYGGLVGLVVMLPVMLLFGYVFGRISVSFVLTIRDRKISLGGWNASKGAGLQLLFSHIVIYVVLIIVQFLLAPDLMATAMSGMTDPAAMANMDAMVASMVNPYGDMLVFALPLQMAFLFLFFGPTAAVAAWDSRKQEASAVSANNSA